MLRRIQQTIHERGLLREGGHVVAAVSGGADSTAMLYALWFLSSKLDFKLTAAHLHHGFRGADADRDAESVEQLCFRLNIPVEMRREDVAATRSGPGMSFEMAARAARQEFFLDVLAARAADAVAVAHTRDDQAETVFMRVLSGAGPDGLAGMAYVNEPAKGLRVIRPMLDVSRESVEAFLRGHGIPWRDDATNLDSRYVRSRVRHVLLPYIASKGFPHVSNALVRLGEIMREESTLLEKQTASLLRGCLGGRGRDELVAAELAKLGRAEQRRVVRAWLAGRGLGFRTAEFHLIERILRLVEGGRKDDVFVDAQLRIVRSGGRLRCRSGDEAPRRLEAVALSVPGETAIPGTDLVVTVVRSHGYWKTPSAVGQFPAAAYLRRDRSAPDWVIRSRLPGDSIVPTGMKGKVFLKDLFINEKVPVEQRGMVPVLAAGDDVAWVAGYRVAEAWSVPAEGAPSWKIVIEHRKPR